MALPPRILEIINEGCAGIEDLLIPIPVFYLLQAFDEGPQHLVAHMCHMLLVHLKKDNVTLEELADFMQALINRPKAKVIDFVPRDKPKP
jgi:hypothetical protein